MLKRVPAVLVALMVWGVAHALPLKSKACAPTVEAAVTRMLQPEMAGEASEGFRVDAVRVDRVRGLAYAIVVSCREGLDLPSRLRCPRCQHLCRR